MVREVIVGDKYEINLSGHDRNGQVITVFHDSAVLNGREIVRSHCIVEDETGHRFIVRKLCLSPHRTREETELLYEHGAVGHLEGDDNHIGSGDSAISNHE